MGRLFTARAEIFGGVDEADAEIRLPDTIDEGAGRRGRFAIHQPPGQRKARAVGVGR